MAELRRRSLVLRGALAAALGCCFSARAAAVQEPSRPANAPADSAARAQIAAAVEDYLIAARAVDGDAVASKFTLDGTLFEPGIQPLSGREAIRKFMKSFPGVQVHAATKTAEEIQVFGDVGYVWGAYFEKLSFPGQPTSEQHGRFVMEWRRQSSVWRVRRYFRVPVTTTTRPAASTRSFRRPTTADRPSSTKTPRTFV